MWKVVPAEHLDMVYLIPDKLRTEWGIIYQTRSVKDFISTLDIYNFLATNSDNIPVTIGPPLHYKI